MCIYTYRVDIVWMASRILSEFAETGPIGEKICCGPLRQQAGRHVNAPRATCAFDAQARARMFARAVVPARRLRVVIGTANTHLPQR